MHDHSPLALFGLLVLSTTTGVIFAQTSGFCQPCPLNVGSNVVDVSSLCEPTGQGYTVVLADEKQYQFNICGSIEAPCEPISSVCIDNKVCGLVNDGVVNVAKKAVAKEHNWRQQCGTSGSCVRCRTLISALDIPEVSLISPAQPEIGVQIKYKPMQRTVTEQMYETDCAADPQGVIRIECACGTEIGSFSVEKSPGNSCLFTFKTTSEHACPEGYCSKAHDPAAVAPSPGPSPQPDDGGDAAVDESAQGGVFGTILSVVLIVLLGYCVFANWVTYRATGNFGLPDEHVRFCSIVTERISEVFGGVVSSIKSLFGSRTTQRFQTVDSDHGVNSAATANSPFQTQADTLYSDDI